MEYIVELMKEPCHLLEKRGTNEWREYSPEDKAWSPAKGIMTYLTSGHNIINWGNRIFSNDRDPHFKLNKPSAIKKASNKATGRRILQDAGAAVPRTVFYGETFIEFPSIARPPRHNKGHDFYVVNNLNDVAALLKEKGSLEDWYFSEIFEKTTEFRTHCAHGKILITNLKPRTTELTADNVRRWEVLRWSDFIPAVSQASLFAVETLGLDYGAVDVMYNENTGQVAIAEVNTSPEFFDYYTTDKYARYFDWAIRHNFPAHFEPQGTSVFYNNILDE